MYRRQKNGSNNVRRVIGIQGEEMKVVSSADNWEELGTILKFNNVAHQDKIFQVQDKQQLTHLKQLSMLHNIF